MSPPAVAFAILMLALAACAATDRAAVTETLKTINQSLSTIAVFKVGAP